MPAGSSPFIGSSRIRSSRVGQQAAGDPQALAHAERVGLDLVVGAGGEPDPLERGGDPCRGGAVAGGRVDCEVLASGQMGVEARLLDDRADPGQGLGAAGRQAPDRAAASSRRRLGEAEQQPDQRGLAGAVGPEEAEGGPAGNLEVTLSSAARVPNRLPRPCV